MSWLKLAPMPSLVSKVGVARIYQYRDRYFICSVAGISETESITIFPKDVSESDLGEATIRHLMEFSHEDARDLTKSRSTDWRAFRESGAKSIKTFEPELWHVDVSLRNGGVEIHARPRLSLKDHLSVYAYVQATLPESVGTAVREAIGGAQALREQGLI